MNLKKTGFAMNMKTHILFNKLILSLILILQCHVTLQNPIAQEICDTPACHRVAQNLKESLDPIKDPCENFYQFACGNWPNTHPNKTPYTANSTLQERSRRNTLELLGFIKQKNSEDEPKTLHKLRKLFTLCTDESTIQEKSPSFVQSLLREAGIPEVVPLEPDHALDPSINLAKMYRLFGDNLIFILEPGRNPNNEMENVLTLTETNLDVLEYLPMFENKVFDEEEDEQYSLSAAKDKKKTPKTKIKIVIKNTGTSDSTTTTTRRSIFRTSTTTTTMRPTTTKRMTSTTTSPPPSNRQSDLNVTLSLRDLQKLTDETSAKIKGDLPTFNWTKYLSVLYDDISDVHLDLSKPDDIKIAIPSKNELDTILSEIHGYFNYRFGWGIILAKLSSFASTNEVKLPTSESRLSEKVSREETCLNAFNSGFSLAMSYFYAANPYHKEIKKEVNDLVFNIKESLQNLIMTASWLDTETKKKALKKLNALKPYIAYPDFVGFSKTLDDYYESLVVTDNFLESYLRTEQNEIKKKLRSLNTINRLKDSRIEISPTTVDAYYSSSKNIMVIPAGILGMPIYEHGLRSSIYGSVGIIIGHEITHGFDNQGSKYNENGDLEEWWNPKTLEEYKKRARCFINTYGSYSETFQNITQKGDSNYTLGEDIADNDAFKEVLLAYRDHVSLYGAEPLLPTLENYTHEQILTLSYANLWCENPTPESAMKAKYNTHSPNGVRVNGVFKNSEEFAKIWNCSKGSQMNPNVEKCTLF